MVPIDECREEMFEGGCYNFLNVTGKPNLINTNGTSLIGVETFVQAKEGCYSELFPPVQECSPTYCLNGGTCKLDDWQELRYGGLCIFYLYYYKKIVNIRFGRL